MPRPAKLTLEVSAKICQAVEAGNYYEAACGCAGITYRTFRNWMTRGQRSKQGIYFHFFHAVQKAKAASETRLVELWQQQIPDNWQAARDFLERRFKKRWGRKEALEHSGPGGKPIQANVQHSWDDLFIRSEIADPFPSAVVTTTPERNGVNGTH